MSGSIIHVRLLNEREVSIILNVSVKLLQKQRGENSGIPYIKIGGCIRYKIEDVEKYLNIKLNINELVEGTDLPESENTELNYSTSIYLHDNEESEDKTTTEIGLIINHVGELEIEINQRALITNKLKEINAGFITRTMGIRLRNALILLYPME